METQDAEWQPLFRLQIPWNQSTFWAMSEDEAKEFFAFFKETIPLRISWLKWMVNRTPGYEDWRPDCDVGSYDTLERWLRESLPRFTGDGAGQIKPPPPQDTSNIIASNDPWPPSNDADQAPWTTSDMTMAVSMAAGSYIGECIRRAYPMCRWMRRTAKLDVDQNQPLLGLARNCAGGFNAVLWVRGKMIYRIVDDPRVSSISKGIAYWMSVAKAGTERELRKRQSNRPPE
ncbi:MAG: hypothetical protein JNL50_14885 [Phycisphaerae bacterium]|nr:hypothetical protein [Phycisphaerae bacterium]